MQRGWTISGLTLGLLLAWTVTAAPVPEEPSATKIEAQNATTIVALEARIAELEAQNQAILQALQQLQQQLAATGSAASSVAAASQPAGAPQVVHAVQRSAATTRLAQAGPAAPSPSPAAKSEPFKDIQVGQSRLSFYGFLRLDAIYDDSRPDSLQSPLFILSEGPGAEDEDSFNFHPRLTRFGMNYDGPKLGGDGAKLGGKIEIDMQNGGRESRQQLRLRHGYMTLDWGKTTLLLGQTWDLFSPLYPTVNADTLMWNAGNLGDRRPQMNVRTAIKGDGGEFNFHFGLGLTGAITGQDTDRDGVRDGDDAVLPNLQSRIGYARSGDKGSFSAGLSGHFGREEFKDALRHKQRYDSHSLNLDWKVVYQRLTFQGELWNGENLPDFRGGIAQGVNAQGKEIESSGGWLELGLRANDSYSGYLGYSVDDPQDADLGVGGRTHNSSWYWANRFNFGRPFQIGVDYLRWTTEYKGQGDGTDNRVNLFLIYNF